MAPRLGTSASMPGVPRRFPRRVVPIIVVVDHVGVFDASASHHDSAVVVVAAAAARKMTPPTTMPPEQCMKSKLITPPITSHCIENVRDLA